MTGAEVDLRDVRKSFEGGRIRALAGVSLHLDPGELVSLTGPSGCGKSTLLNLVGALDRADSGEILVAGESVSKLANPARYRAETVGFVFQFHDLIPTLNALENVEVPMLGRRPRSFRVARATELLEEVGLADRARDRYRAYSLGMKQRLGIAAALLKDPALLILDEPTNGMDPAGMAEMRDFVRRLGRGGRTVLLSSHLMNEVEQVCDRVGVISGGRLVAEGTVDELRGREHLLVRAEPLDRAEALVGSLRGVEDVERVDGRLRVAAGVVPAHEVNRALVAAGIGVAELRPERTSLEDVFFELTREEASR